MNWIRSFVAVWALALGLPLSAQAATQTIVGNCWAVGPPLCSATADPRPLSIFIADSGSLQAKRGEQFAVGSVPATGAVAGMFFGSSTAPAANFWHLRVKGAPAANVTFGPRDSGVTTVSNSPVQGDWTAASPARVDTVTQIQHNGVNLFEVTQTVLYVAPELRYRVIWRVRNIDPQNRTIPFVFGTSADLFIESDASRGLFADGPSRFVGGTHARSLTTGGLQEVTASQLPGEAGATPVPRWASYEEGDPFHVIRRLSNGDAFPNTINPANMDNGIGVSFDDRATAGLAPGATARYEVIWHLTRPTPLNASPQIATKELPGSHTVTLSLVDPSFNPVSGATVRYRRTGPNAVGAQSVTTNAQGLAQVTWGGTTAGVDTLLAWIDTNGDSVQDPDESAASATVRWLADNHVAGPPTVTPPAGVTPTVQANPENGEAPTFQFDQAQTASAGFAACTFDARTGRNVNLPVSATLQGGAGTISNAQLFLLDRARHNPNDLGTPLPAAALADGTAQQSGAVYAFTVPCLVSGDMWLQFTLTEGAATQTFRVPIGGLQLIDPQGVVYDGARYDAAIAAGSTPAQARVAAAIAGATARLQRLTPGGFVNVLSGDPGITPNVNPQTTGASGIFQWDVAPGTYRVLVSAPGCESAIGGPVDIPPPALDVHVRLDCGPGGDGGASSGGAGGGASGGGGSAGGGASAIDSTAPRLFALKLAPATFRVSSVRAAPATARPGRRAALGSKITFRLSERASVVLRIERRTSGRRVGATCAARKRANRAGRPCARHVLVGTLKRGTLAAGIHRLAFSGRLGAKKLATGRYRVLAVATDSAANSGEPRTAPFSIVRR